MLALLVDILAVVCCLLVTDGDEWEEEEKETANNRSGHIERNTAARTAGVCIIIIINEIYRAQNSQGQQMRQVSCCMITVILVQEHFQSFPDSTVYST